MLSLVANRLDVFFITGHLSIDELGYYGAALRLMTFVSLITSVTTTILTPKAPLAWADKTARSSYFLQATFYFVVQAFAALCLFVLMDLVVSALFGQQYTSVGRAADVLLLQVLFAALGLPFQLLIQCSTRPQYMVFINILRLVVGVLVLSALVPAYGVVGAAVGVTATSLLLLICVAGLSAVLLTTQNVARPLR
jgi:O-antigen/teichoic acid export membrane protein